MATSDQMTGYAAHLNANTPSSSKCRPVTEIAIFTLQPPYDQDHAAAASEFDSQIVGHCRPGSPYVKGIRKIAWGFSPNDPKAFVWMLDWDKIEDHWDVWLTPGFLPFMAAISNLFVLGRPLVRHYDFGEQGMMLAKIEVVRIMIWNVLWEDQRPSKKEIRGNTEIKHSDVREAYAVDLDESMWWVSMLGYGSEKDAREAKVNPGPDAVNHIFCLDYALLA